MDANNPGLRSAQEPVKPRCGEERERGGQIALHPCLLIGAEKKIAEQHELGLRFGVRFGDGVKIGPHPRPERLGVRSRCGQPAGVQMAQSGEECLHVGPIRLEARVCRICRVRHRNTRGNG